MKARSRCTSLDVTIDSVLDPPGGGIPSRGADLTLSPGDRPVRYCLTAVRSASPEPPTREGNSHILAVRSLPLRRRALSRIPRSADVGDSELSQYLRLNSRLMSLVPH